MTILTGPVNSTANTFSASDDSLLLPNGLPQMLQIESEKFLIRGFEAVGAHNTRWYVDRGVDGSSAASHSGGTAITAVSSGAGGGGVSVTDGTTTVAAATSIQTGVVTDLGAGAATAGTCVISDVDPGAIGAGNLWVQTDPDEHANNNQIWARDADDANWVRASVGDALGGGSLINLTSFGGSDYRKWAQLQLRGEDGFGDAGAINLVLKGGVATTLGSLGMSATGVGIQTDSTSLTLIEAATQLQLIASGGMTINGLPVGTQADHVADGSTVDQLRDALIASGLMAAS